jgi:hypothetical protein
MPTCNLCGEEIEFRYIGGRATPIHVTGRWCTGYSSGSISAVAKPFQTIVSYVNPKARCPVCGERVYFYQSPHGGRVFFNDLGWPWEKHGCTDNPKSQSGIVKTVAQSVHTSFRNREGEPLDLYELSSLTEKDNVVHMRFSRSGENRSFRASVSVGELRGWKVTVADLRAAPSFVVRSSGEFRILEFISGRKQAIDRIVVRKPKPSA